MKRFWTPKSIRSKLLVAFIAIDLVLVISIGSLSYFRARNALRNEAFAGIEALREARSEQIMLWFSDRQRDVQALAANPTILTSAKAAIDSLDDGVNADNTREKNLQAIAAEYRYHPELQDAGDKSIYSSIHNRAHAFYQEILEINHYDDILIISPSGDVVYSVDKRDDFASNVLDPAGSALAIPFLQAINAGKPDFTTFTDITSYGPAAKPVVFFAAPIYSKSNLIGVLVLELPIDTLNKILNLREGLGATGETYVVGNDLLFRNDSRFLKSLRVDTTILNSSIKVNTDASRSALRNQTDTRIITGYRGVSVLSAWKPLNLQSPSVENPNGVIWALIVEKEISEVEQPARNLLVSIFVLSLLISLGAFGFSYIISSQISNPLRQLTETAERITSGQLDRQVNIATQGEVGILAQSFNKMTGQLRNLIDSLEERVNARTRDLQIASDVSKQITTMLDIDKLLQQVVMLTASSFNFYVVFVYLLDDTRQLLISAAGADASGNIVSKENHHDIPVNTDPSIIALAARTRDTIIVNDVKGSPSHLFHPAFPSTCSELAIPMMLGHRLLGIFNLQSEQVNRFGPEELNVLKTLAEQIAIAVRNAQLFANVQAAQAAAEMANQAKSVFLANMSHELRTPLNAILGFSQLMVRDSDTSTTQRQYLDIISRSGEYLLQLINDVLEMSKIEAGRVTLHVESFDLYYMLFGLEEMLKGRAQDKGLYLTFVRTERVPQFVVADESKLRQVLVNLIGNGIKFTRHGGVTVRIDYPTEKRLVFDVEDTGSGIDKAELEKVFEIFTQTQSGQESHEGTGLGLPISRRFVQLMGGKISVKSELEKGSVFTFDIRIDLAESTDIKSVEPRRDVIGLTPGQPVYRILIVEDKWESRVLLTRLLEPIGFEVLTAMNGQEALTLYQTYQPSLIFMDMRMPVMDGYETTRRIKSSPGGQKTPIIAVTASAFEHERAQILACGCDDFIGKPFKARDIFDRIARYTGAQFIYKDQTSELPAILDTTGSNLTPDVLRELPPEWCARLSQVAKAAKAEESLQLIEQIRAEHPVIAEALTKLVDNFRFDILMNLSDGSVTV